MSTRSLGAPGDQGKQVRRLLRNAVTVRYCDPAEYAVRILGEIALLAAVLAALEWLLPVYRLPGLTAWPDLGGDCCRHRVRCPDGARRGAAAHTKDSE